MSPTKRKEKRKNTESVRVKEVFNAFVRLAGVFGSQLANVKDSEEKDKKPKKREKKGR